MYVWLKVSLHCSNVNVKYDTFMQLLLSPLLPMSLQTTLMNVFNRSLLLLTLSGVSAETGVISLSESEHRCLPHSLSLFLPSFLLPFDEEKWEVQILSE